MPSPQLELDNFCRVVVTGDTKWEDSKAVEQVLDQLVTAADQRGKFTLLTGMASGADEHARTWAAGRSVDIFAEPLSSGTYPTPMHNYNYLLLSHKPDLVLAFKSNFAPNWGSSSCVRGTEHMCRIAAQADVPVLLNAKKWLE